MSYVDPQDYLTALQAICELLETIAANTSRPITPPADDPADDHAPMSVREARGEVRRPVFVHAQPQGVIGQPAPVPTTAWSGQPLASLVSSERLIVLPRAIVHALATNLADFAWGEPTHQDVSEGRYIPAPLVVVALNQQYTASRFLDACERAFGASFGSWRDA